MTRRKVIVILSLMLALNGCSTAYYAAWEKLGKQKRDLLRDNVQAVRSEQQQAQEQFKDALTRLKELQNFDGGKLEKQYQELKDEYNDAEARAGAVKDRVDKIDDIAKDLFAEWQAEIKKITNSGLRNDSANKRAATQKRYRDLNEAMTAAVTRMDKVLVKLNDYVLYLKHNLNAQVVGGLKAEVVKVEQDVSVLIEDVQASIKKADKFVKTL